MSFNPLPKWRESHIADAAGKLDVRVSPDSGPIVGAAALQKGLDLSCIVELAYVTSVSGWDDGAFVRGTYVRLMRVEGPPRLTRYYCDGSSLFPEAEAEVTAAFLASAFGGGIEDSSHDLLYILNDMSPLKATGVVLAMANHALGWSAYQTASQGSDGTDVPREILTLPSVRFPPE